METPSQRSVNPFVVLGDCVNFLHTTKWIDVHVSYCLKRKVHQVHQVRNHFVHDLFCVQQLFIMDHEQAYESGKKHPRNAVHMSKHLHCL